MRTICICIFSCAVVTMEIEWLIAAGPAARKRGMRMKTMIAAAAMATLLASTALAGEQRIGEPVGKNGMEIAAVYLQAVTMEPAHAHHADTDIHIEADVKGMKGNSNGFAEGDWIPYLDISYELTKPGSAFRKSGKLVPMVASDGPHYGDNVRMDGPGKYRVAYKIAPAAHGFLRHTDKETGVGKWYEPFTVEWDFTYVGSTGKKGGY